MTPDGWVQLLAIIVGSGFFTYAAKEAKRFHGLLRQQFTPNGGTSIYDMLRRIEESVNINEAKNNVLLSVSDQPIFQTDANGRYTWVNPAYCKFTSCPESLILQLNWLNTIAPEDRDKVAEAWHRCCKQQRKFDITYTLADTEIKVHCEAHPYFHKNELQGYVGRLCLNSDSR